MEKTGAQTSSHLLLSAMQVSDSGNYTCSPVSAPTATVSVHVHSDEIRAAVQQDGVRSVSCQQQSPALLTLMLLVLTSVYHVDS
ncbi:hypothetical protein FHG87_022657 [Trinorchestia longiramus]|nr:hypothetical protein FHG87_022657 [Trinorchestia longiramus]